MRLFNTASWIIVVLAATSLGARNGDLPFATRVVSMQYPRLAALANMTGTAVLRVRIDSAGRVLSAKGLSGHPILVKAAEANMKLWRFAARRSAGEGAESEFHFTYVFELRGTSDAQLPCSGLTYEYPAKVTIVSEAPPVMP